MEMLKSVQSHISFYTVLCYLFMVAMASCSKEPISSEETQSNVPEVSVSSTGQATAITGATGKVRIISEVMENAIVEFEVRDLNGASVRGIRLKYGEKDNVTFAYFTDPSGKYDETIFWGDPREVSRSSKLTETQGFIFVPILIGVTTALAYLSAVDAFDEIEKFELSRRVIDNMGNEVLCFTATDIIELQKKQFGGRLSFISVGVGVLGAGVGSIKTSVLKVFGDKLIATSTKKATEALGKWLIDKKGREWFEQTQLDENTLLAVRNYTWTNVIDDFSGGIDISIDPSTCGIVAKNTPPTITSSPSTTAKIGDTYTYRVNATDNENDPLSYRLVTKPNGMSINSDGIISWTPSSSQLGNNQVVVEVSDGTNTVRQSFAVNVMVIVDDSAAYEGLKVWEILDKIKELAAVNAPQAFQDCSSIFQSIGMRGSCIADVAEISLDKSYCEGIENAKTKDKCFSNVAVMRRESPICKEIEDESIRDSCYMTFALDYNDYSTCAYIMDQQLRESCDSLRRFNR